MIFIPDALPDPTLLFIHSCDLDYNSLACASTWPNIDCWEIKPSNHSDQIQILGSDVLVEYPATFFALDHNAERSGD